MVVEVLLLCQGLVNDVAHVAEFVCTWLVGWLCAGGARTGPTVPDPSGFETVDDFNDFNESPSKVGWFA